MDRLFKSTLEVLNITFPIFAIVAIGYFMRRKKILDEKATEALNKLAYNLGLPSLIFISIISNKLEDIFNLKVIEAIYSTVVLFTGMSMLVFVFVKTDRRTRGAMIVSSFRCNMAFIGFPIILSAYGTLAMAKASLVVAFLTPVNVIFSVLIFRFFSGEKDGSLSKLFLGLARDPLIIAAVSGIVFSYFNLRIPDSIMSVFDILSGMAMAIALISIGASFKFFHVRENMKFLSLVSLLKLMVLPLVGLLLCIFVFRINKLDRDVVCLLFSMPVAVTTFIMGVEHNSDYDFISSSLIFSTIVSAFTISMWLLVLKLF
ncbi:MAG: AEC family transporter [Actinobacteria bacterium]|nr:AEC family transporter [Actinomycetota bacterium]